MPNWTVIVCGVLCVLAFSVLGGVIRIRARERSMSAARTTDPFVGGADAGAGRLGLSATDLKSAVSTWHLPPLVPSEDLQTDDVLFARSGNRWGRHVVVAVMFEYFKKYPHNKRNAQMVTSYLLMTVARLNVHPTTLPWIACTPAGWESGARRTDPRTGSMFAIGPTMGRRKGRIPGSGGISGTEVPAPVQPEQWHVRAHNVPFAAGLLHRLTPQMSAEGPHVWHIDGLDVVRIDPIAKGATPPGPADLDRLIGGVCRTADAIEELIHQGYGDRPFTPSWPEDSGITQRFPPDVTAELVQAGWVEGRDVSGRSEQRWLPAVRQRGRFPEHRIVPDVLREFGGLRFPARAAWPARPAIDLDPVSAADYAESFERFAERWPRPLYPFGMVRSLAELGPDADSIGPSPVREHPIVLGLDGEGRVYGLGRDFDRLLGYNPDEGIIKLLRGLLAPMIVGDIHHGSLKD